MWRGSLFNEEPESYSNRKGFAGGVLHDRVSESTKQVAPLRMACISFVECTRNTLNPKPIGGRNYKEAYIPQLLTATGPTSNEEEVSTTASSPCTEVPAQIHPHVSLSPNYIYICICVCIDIDVVCHASMHQCTSKPYIEIVYFKTLLKSALSQHNTRMEVSMWHDAFRKCFKEDLSFVRVLRVRKSEP